MPINPMRVVVDARDLAGREGLEHLSRRRPERQGPGLDHGLQWLSSGLAASSHYCEAEPKYAGTTIVLTPVGIDFPPTRYGRPDDGSRTGTRGKSQQPTGNEIVAILAIVLAEAIGQGPEKESARDA